MALVTVWNMANLASTMILDEPLPSFYTLSMTAGKKLLFWGLDTYFKSKGDKYYYIYKLSVNYRGHKSLVQTLAKDAAVSYLPSPMIIPEYLWNYFVPQSVKTTALLVLTRTASTFSYTVIQDPSSPALKDGASNEVIEREVESQYQKYKYVNVNLNDVLANEDHHLKDLLADWILAEDTGVNQAENSEDEEESDSEEEQAVEITVNNQSISIIPNYISKLQENPSSTEEIVADNDMNSCTELNRSIIIIEDIIDTDALQVEIQDEEQAVTDQIIMQSVNN